MTSCSTTVEDCTVIHLNHHIDQRGHLTSISSGLDFSFDIKRVFYQYEVPNTAIRGGHAHRECHQVLIAVSGAVEVILDDGHRKRLVQLYHPDTALHIVPGIWATQFNFAPGTVCLVLASHAYDPNDYVCGYASFKQYKVQKQATAVALAQP